MASLPGLRHRLRSATRRIIIHSSHTGPEVPSVEQHLRVLGRKMGLLEVGYHMVVERDGKTANCRPHAAYGAHTPGHNEDSIGVCVAGGRNEEGWADANAFTPTSYQQALYLVEFLLLEYGPILVVGHTEIQHYRNRAMRCPEFNMKSFRKRLMAPHQEPTP